MKEGKGIEGKGVDWRQGKTRRKDWKELDGFEINTDGQERLEERKEVWMLCLEEAISEVRD